MSKVQNVFLIGAKSLGAYGGYETFVYKLTEYHQNNPNIKYHVACKANGDGCMDETKLQLIVEQILNLISLTQSFTICPLPMVILMLIKR